MPSGLRAPFIVWALVAAMVLAYAAFAAAPLQTQYELLFNFALIPERYESVSSARYLTWADAAAPIVGHVFLHGSWLHLGLNAFFFFGAARWPAVRLGTWRFLAVVLASAAVGALFYVVINWGGRQPAVGASGAVCGVFTAYLLAQRPHWREALAVPEIRNQLATLVMLNVVVMGVLAAFGLLPIAWEAHLGGFIGGGVAYALLERPWPALEEAKVEPFGADH